MKNTDTLKEGIAYLEKLKGVDPSKSKLGAEVLYNFICLGIESVLTAVLMENGKVVDHSGIGNLIRELKNVEEVDPMWVDTARYMNRFNSYCSMEPIAAKIPNNDELKQFIVFGLSVLEYGQAKL